MIKKNTQNKGIYLKEKMNKYLLLTLSIVIISVIVINSAKNIPDKKLHVIVCDVGQGDGIIIKTPQNKTLLIDAGPDTSIQQCLNKHKAFYDHHINAIFVTHFHADHIVGFIDLFKSYVIDTIVKDELNYPSSEKKEFEVESLNETKNIQEAWQGDSIEVEPDVIIYVLWPTESNWNRVNGNWEAYLSDFNDSSLVLLLKYKNAAVLLTGDAGSQVLDKIAGDEHFAALIKDTHVRIYKAAHHGSRDASSEKLLDIFQPALAIISEGKNNKFGHPHKEAIKALDKYNIRYYKTEDKGNVEIITDGKSLKVKTER
jgi:competence protein ComEC